MRVNDCMVVYKGELAQFGLQSDGTFSYIAIGKCCRGMLDLAAPETAIDRHPIGSSHGEKLASILAERGSGFIVRGSEISNVVFERRVDFTDGIDEAIAAAKAKRQREAEEAHVSSGRK
ncbi:MAG: hypothetical protein IT332_07665 [Ardenticatenales bacterium]|nr:hypothetical protein [Ardenticatenales bacterium]